MGLIVNNRENLAVRNVGLLLLFRILVLAGGAATAALLPRIMGPELFGRYALLSSLTQWFTFLGGMGIAQVVSRQVPAILQAKDDSGFRSLVGNLMGLRMLTGSLAAAIYLGVTLTWLRDMNAWVVLLLGVALLLRSPVGISFAVFLGQGRIARWALSDVIRQWGSLAFTVPAFLLFGFLGAGIGYLACELAVLALAITGMRAHLPMGAIRIRWRELSPHLRLGLLLYLSELILSATERSGESLLRIMTGSYVLVGHYGVANTIYFNAILALQQIATAFVPMFIALRAQSDFTEMSHWIERLLKWLGLGALLIFLGSVFLSRELVSLLFGPDYRGVEKNLVVLAGALVMHTLCFIGAAQALVFDRPLVLIVAGLVRLAVFWLVGLLLARSQGSFGMCLAMLAGVTCQAVFYVVQTRKVLALPLKRFLLQIALAFPPVSLVLLPVTGIGKVVLCLAALLGYIGLVSAFRLISSRELRTFREVLGNRRRGEAGMP